MIKIDNIFAVIDPSTDKQYALERAMRIARVVDAKIHAYLCISATLEAHDQEALYRVEMARYEPWLESLVEGAKAEGFNITSELDYRSDWRHTLGPASRKANSDLIIKSSHRRSVAKQLMMTSSDLALLATASCPVLLVSSEAADVRHKVLIAVDATREDEKYQAIFNAVVAYGKAAAASLENGELHAACAYSGSEDFRHITDIAKRVDIDTSHVHELEGKPEEVIAEIASEISPQLVIIGLSTKSALRNRIFGHMIDRLLNSIDHDILVVVPEEE